MARKKARKKEDGAQSQELTTASPEPEETQEVDTYSIETRGAEQEARDNMDSAQAMQETMLNKIFGEEEVDTSRNEVHEMADAESRAMWCGLLHPATTVNKCYWALHVGVLLWLLFILPYRLAFNVQCKGACFVGDVCIDVFFAVDIVLNFRFFYMDDHQRLVTSGPAISRRYLRSWFVVDFVSVFPLDWAIIVVRWVAVDDEDAFQTTAVEKARFIKICRLLRLRKVAQIDWVNVLGTAMSGLMDKVGVRNASLQIRFYMRIFYLNALLVTAVHVIACVWGHIGLRGIAGTPQTGWLVLRYCDLASTAGETCALVDGRVVVPTIGHVYLTSFYYALVTISGVGYGDIHPTDSAERIAVCFVLLVGVLLYAYILGSFGMMISNIAHDENAFDSKMRSVLELMKTIGAPPEITQDIMHYYSYKFETKTMFVHEELMDELPGDLRHAVIKAQFSRVIRSVPFLRGVDDRVLVQICSTLDTFSVMPNEFICCIDDEASNLLIITKGLVKSADDRDSEAHEMAVLEAGDDEEELLRLKNKKIKMIEDQLLNPENERVPGSFFGIQEFLGLRDTRSSTLQAVVYTEIAVLKRESMENVLADNLTLLRRMETYAKVRRELMVGTAEHADDPDYLRDLSDRLDGVIEDFRREDEHDQQQREAAGQSEYRQSSEQISNDAAVGHVDLETLQETQAQFDALNTYMNKIERNMKQHHDEHSHQVMQLLQALHAHVQTTGGSPGAPKKPKPKPERDLE